MGLNKILINLSSVLTCKRLNIIIHEYQVVNNKENCSKFYIKLDDGWT